MTMRAGRDDSLKHSGPSDQQDVLVSLVLLALIIILALGRISLDENWRKVLRVSLAFLAYNAVLLALVGRVARASVRLPFWIFAAAAGLAELVSGWLRVNWRPSDLALAPLAALLLGGVHWLSLRAWRLLRARIEMGRRPA